MKVSFIVITYHRGPLLLQCLDSIYRQEGLPYPYEVIVIDNGGDVELPPPPNPQILLRLEKPTDNLGCADGRNRGMEIAVGDYWIFIDDDAAWHCSTDVATLIRHLDNTPDCGAVALKSLSATGETIREELTHPNKDYLMGVTEAVDVPYFYGYGHVLRAEAVRKSGFYPSRFGIYMEDLDMSVGIIKNGFRIIFEPAVAVIHYKSNLGRPILGDNYWHNCTLNKSRVAWRHYPYPYPLTILFVWSLATLVKTRKPSVVAKVWQALWQERKLLAAERKPYTPNRLGYLKCIGGRLLY